MWDVDRAMMQGKDDNKYTEPSQLEKACKLMTTLPIKEQTLL